MPRRHTSVSASENTICRKTGFSIESCQMPPLSIANCTSDLTGTSCGRRISRDSMLVPHLHKTKCVKEFPVDFISNGNNREFLLPCSVSTGTWSSLWLAFGNHGHPSDLIYISTSTHSGGIGSIAIGVVPPV